MNTIGFANKIQRKDSKQIVTIVLNYEELKDNKLILGEFMLVMAGGTRKFLARVEDCYYAPVTIGDDEKNKALAAGRLNNDMDQSSVKYINFLHYDLVLLGELPPSGKQFFAGIREVPSLMDIQVHRPNEDELNTIVNAKVPGGEGSVNSFELGRLQYGTRLKEDGTPALPQFEVKISFNIANLLQKRTAVFGKTGFGKSNLIKTLITLAHKNSPDTPQLIFDVNGEYAFSNKQGKGLLDIFAEARQKNKIVVYSNRKDATAQYGSDVIKSIKFDVIENPELAVSLLIGKRLQKKGELADYLETLADPDMHPTTRSFWRCFCVLELGLKTNASHKAKYKPNAGVKVESGDLDGSGYVNDFQKASDLILASKADTTKNLHGKGGQFSFLKRMHFLEGDDEDRSEAKPLVNFNSELMEDVRRGKVIILDLPSMDSNMLAPLSDKIATDLFRTKQNSFLISSVKSDNQISDQIIVFIEEAHNVLSDKQNTIFPRLAREGRKYGIGMVFSTQRPGSIDEDILTQTENFFVMHLGSKQDVQALENSKIAFGSPISDFILTEPAVGVAFVYSEPYQPYVLSCKVRRFEDVLKDNPITKK